MRLFGYLLALFVFGAAGFVGHEFYQRFEEQRLAVIEAQRVVNTLREENFTQTSQLQATLAEANRRASEAEASLTETKSRLEEALKDKDVLQVAIVGRLEELMRLARETRLLSGRSTQSVSEHEGAADTGQAQDNKPLPAPKLKLPKGITKEQEREALERRGAP